MCIISEESPLHPQSSWNEDGTFQTPARCALRRRRQRSWIVEESQTTTSPTAAVESMTRDEMHSPTNSRLEKEVEDDGSSTTTTASPVFPLDHLVFHSHTDCYDESIIKTPVRRNSKPLSEFTVVPRNSINNSPIVRVQSVLTSSSTGIVARPPARRRRYLIPANHPLKILWDVLTVVWSLIHAYNLHLEISSRRFDDASPFRRFIEMWFWTDILLNFLTEHRIGNLRLVDFRAVAARYLTTWFVIDVISLLPGELLFLQPIINRQNRRHPLRKFVARSRAVTKVTSRLLQSWGWVRTAARHSKHVGGVARVTKLSIFYIPKYFLFWKHMKCIVGIRLLRQVHWFRRLKTGFWSNPILRKWRKRNRPPVEEGWMQPKNTEDDNHTLHTVSESEEDDDDEDWEVWPPISSSTTLDGDDEEPEDEYTQYLMTKSSSGISMNLELDEMVDDDDDGDPY